MRLDESAAGLLADNGFICFEHGKQNVHDDRIEKKALFFGRLDKICDI